MIGVSSQAEKLLNDLRIIAEEVPFWRSDREQLALERIQRELDKQLDEIWILRERIRKVIDRARDKKEEVKVKDGAITDLHTMLNDLRPIVRML